MKPQDILYVGKIGTDYVQLNKYVKNLSNVRKIYRFNGSDLDGIFQIHPDYARYYRSTSHVGKCI